MKTLLTLVALLLPVSPIAADEAPNPVGGIVCFSPEDAAKLAAGIAELREENEALAKALNSCRIAKGSCT